MYQYSYISHEQEAAFEARRLEFMSKIEDLDYIDHGQIQWHEGPGSCLGSGGFASVFRATWQVVAVGG